MRKSFATLAFLFLVVFTQGQNNCNPTLPAKVIAESGIKMRTGPGTNFPVTLYIPTDSVVLMCPTGELAASFEGINGYWRLISYKDKQGFAFDGFLKDLNTENDLTTVLEKDSTIVEVEEQNPKPVIPKQRLNYKLLTEVYNYCGDISSIDPGLVWYGIYRDEDQYFIKRREIQVLKSKYSLSKSMEFDIRTESSEKATHFLIGFPVVQDFDTLAPLVFHTHEFNNKLPLKIFPGMQMGLYGKEPGLFPENIILSAVGNVKDVGICPDLDNYQLRITGEKNGQPIQQLLNSLFIDMGQCGIPELYWFGDLNGDNYPEMIFVTTRPEFYTFSFFTSDTVISDAIYRRAATWTIDNCD